jgi:hypothetical protein
MKLRRLPLIVFEWLVQFIPIKIFTTIYGSLVFMIYIGIIMKEIKKFRHTQ